MTDERTYPNEDSACCSPASAATNDANATDRPSSGASLGRGLDPEGGHNTSMTRKVLAQMDPLTRIRELLHPVDATYSAEPIDIDDARWLLAQLDLKSAPEGERRPPDSTLTAGDLHAAGLACGSQAHMHELQQQGTGAEWEALCQRVLAVAERFGAYTAPKQFTSLLLRNPDGSLAAALPRSPVPTQETP